MFKDKKIVDVGALAERPITRYHISALLIFIIVAIGSLAIAQSDSTLGSDSLRSVLTYTRFALALLVTAIVACSRKKDTFLLLFIPLVHFLVTNLNSYGAAEWNFLYVVYMVAFLWLDRESKRNTFVLFRYFLIIVSIFGIIAYLSYTFSLPVPYDVVDYYGEHITGFYYDYKVAYLCQTENSLVRLCGCFNEPGYLGTVLAFVLCMDNLNLKKASTWIFIIAGCFTFSLAFFLILVLYLILMCRKNIWLMLFLILMFAAYVFVLPNVEFKDPNIAQFIRRFTFSEGALAGDNRSNIFVDNAVATMFAGKDFWFGYGFGYSANQNFGSVATYKTFLLDLGIVLFVLLYSIVIIPALIRARKNWKAVAFCIVFTISIYQRPNIFSATYFLILYGGIEYIFGKSKEVN